MPAPATVTRRVYSIGRSGVPEAADATAPRPAVRYPLLSAVWGLADRDQRLNYMPNVNALNAGTPEASRPTPSTLSKSRIKGVSMPFGGPPGVCRGLYAIKYCVIGTAVEAMDAAIVHVDSLDPCFQGASDVRVKKVVGSGPVTLLLLNVGILLTASESADHHGVAIALPPRDGFGGSPPPVVDVAAGEGHFVCCDSYGRVFTWGWMNQYGQLGRGTVWPARPDLIGQHDPQPLIGFGGVDSSAVGRRENDRAAVESPRIISVACGRHHTVLLTEARTCVYTFGRGHRGQLGWGRQCRAEGETPLRQIVEVAPSPRSVPTLFGIAAEGIFASSDAHHTIVRLKTGLVCFGENSCGQCGSGFTKAIFVPTLVTIPRSEGALDFDQPQRKGVGSDQPPLLVVSSPLTVSTSMMSVSRAPKVAPRYGSFESFMHPRRVPSLDKDIAATSAQSRTIADVVTTATHTLVACDGDGVMLSSGLRPLPLLPTNPLSTAIVAPSALGRSVVSRADAYLFAPMDGLHYEPRDTVALGPGFAAVFNRRRNDVLVVGQLTGPSGTIASSVASLGRTTPGGTVVNAACMVDLGIDKRVLDVFATSRGGLLLLVDCY